MDVSRRCYGTCGRGVKRVWLRTRYMCSSPKSTLQLPFKHESTVDRLSGVVCLSAAPSFFLQS